MPLLGRGLERRNPILVMKINVAASFTQLLSDEACPFAAGMKSGFWRTRTARTCFSRRRQYPLTPLSLNLRHLTLIFKQETAMNAVNSWSILLGAGWCAVIPRQPCRACVSVALLPKVVMLPGAGTSSVKSVSKTVAQPRRRNFCERGCRPRGTQ